MSYCKPELYKAFRDRNFEMVVQLTKTHTFTYDRLPIEVAAKLGDFAAVKYMCELCDTCGMIPHNIQSWDWISREAARHNNFEIVKYFITSEKCAPNSMNNYALRQAAKYGNLEMIKYLCEFPESNPHARQSDAMYLAVANGHSEIAKFLCNLPSPPGYPGLYLEDAFASACNNNNIEMVKFFDSKFEIDLTDYILNAAHMNSLEVLEYMCSFQEDRGIDIHTLNKIIASSRSRCCLHTHYNEVMDFIQNEINMRYNAINTVNTELLFTLRSIVPVDAVGDLIYMYLINSVCPKYQKQYEIVVHNYK